MNLADLNLEKINIPSDYKEIILERREITPELKAQNFMSGVWGKDRQYNFFLIMDGYEPFKLRIIEDDVEDSDAGSLEYHLEIDAEHSLFKSFKLQKYIREHEAGEEYRRFNQKLGAWLVAEIEKISGEEIYEDLYIQTPDDNNEILFNIDDEKVYTQLLTDVSAALRSLNGIVEKMEDTVAVDYDDVCLIEDKMSMKELKAIRDEEELEQLFRDVVCENYITTVYFAVKEAVKILEAEKQKINHLYFVVDVDKGRIRFTLEEEYPEYDDNEYFYNHKVTDNILKKFDHLCDQLELRPSSEAAYYFGQALHMLDEKGAFDNVTDSMLEIMGSYNYYADMEGIFCK